MNKYKVKLGSMAKVPIGIQGIQYPLCDSCSNIHCDNPIEPVQISIFGVNQTVRMYKRNDKHLAVFGCEGYISQQK